MGIYQFDSRIIKPDQPPWGYPDARAIQAPAFDVEIGDWGQVAAVPDTLEDWGQVAAVPDTNKDWGTVL